jgi:predicted ribosomally synthesized peptide with nif11-like leader
MANAQVIAFAQRVESDPELRAKLQALKGKEKGAAVAEVVQLATAAGFRFSPAELESSVKQLAGGELGAEDLDAVVGGSGFPAGQSAFVNTLGPIFTGAPAINPCWRPI